MERYTGRFSIQRALAKLGESGEIYDISQLEPIVHIVPYETLIGLLQNYRLTRTDEYWNNIRDNDDVEIHPIIRMAMIEIMFKDELLIRDVTDIGNRIIQLLTSCDDDVFMYMVKSDSFMLRSFIKNNSLISMSEMFNRISLCVAKGVLGRYKGNGATVNITLADGDIKEAIPLSLNGIMDAFDNVDIYFGEDVERYRADAFRVSLLSSLSAVPINTGFINWITECINVSRENILYETNEVFGIDCIDFIIGGRRYTQRMLSMAESCRVMKYDVTVTHKHNPTQKLHIYKNGRMHISTMTACDDVSKLIDGDVFMTYVENRAVLIKHGHPILGNLFLDIIDPLNRLMSNDGENLNAIETKKLCALNICIDGKPCTIVEIQNILNSWYLEDVPPLEKLVVSSYSHAVASH